MPLLLNTAEGGVSGQTVTTANSGGASGDAWSGVLGTVVFADGGAHGNFCYQANAASSSTFWNVTGTTVRATSPYFRILATPTAAGLFHILYTGGSTTYAVRLLVNTSRQVGIQNAAGTQVGGGASTWALSVGTWYRTETEVTVGTTTSNGSIAVRLYQGDATTPLATYTASGTANTGTATITRVDTGRLSGTGWGSGPQWDTVRTQDSTTPLGPYQALTGAASLSGTGTLVATGTASSGSGGATPRVELSPPTPITRQTTVALPATGSIVTAWNAAIAAAASGDELLIPSGTYTADGNLDVTKSGITITFGEVTVTHTNTTQHSLRVRSGAQNVLIRGVPGATSFDVPKTQFVTTGVSGRGDQNTSGHAGLSIDVGSTGIYVQDLLLQGAKGTGFFNFGGVTIRQNRVWVRNSLADGFHNTYGARDVRAYDCTSESPGDDGYAVVHYSPRDPASLQSSDVVVTRHRVFGTTHGRGLAAVNCPTVNFDTCFVRASDAAGLWIVNENTPDGTNTRAGIGNNTAANIYLYGCNTDTAVDHGSWGIQSSGLPVSGVTLTDITTENPGSSSWTRVVGPSCTATVTRWKQYGAPTVQCYISDATVNDQATWTSTTAATASPNTPQWAASTASSSGGGRPPVSLSPTITLDGDTLGATGTTVASWVDSVANRNFTQATTALQPTVVAAPNSHRAAKFDGDALSSTLTATARQAITVVMVMRVDAIAGVARSGIISAASADGQNDYTATQGAWSLSTPFATSETTFESMLVGGAPTGSDSRIKTSSQPLGQWVIVTAVIGSDGVAQKLYTNGTVDTVNTGGASNPALTFNRLNLGARYYGTLADYGKFSLAHMRVYPDRLTTADRSTVHSDLSDRYGVTVSDYVAPTQSYTGTATLAGSGTLSAAGTPSSTGTATLTGTGTLTGAGVASASGTAILTGSGALAATGTPAVTGAASLTGSGTLTATGAPAGSSAATLTGTGTLTAAGAPNATQAAPLSGTGTLTATGTAAQNGAATAALTGSGALTATGTPRYTQVVTMTGTGTLTASGKASTTGAANLSGAGALTVVGAPSSSSAANLSGTGVLTVATATQFAAVAQLTGLGQLTAVRADAPAYASHTYGTAVIAPHLGTAILATQALGTAKLTSDGTSTAIIAAAAGTAVLNTDTL